MYSKYSFVVISWLPPFSHEPNHNANTHTHTHTRALNTRWSVELFIIAGLAGWNKAGWKNKFRCLHWVPAYRSTGRALSNICIWLKWFVLLFPAGGIGSWADRTVCFVFTTPLICSKHHSTATYPFHVVGLLSAWTAPTRLLSELAHWATLHQRLTNYKSSSKCHKEDFIEDKWK